MADDRFPCGFLSFLPAGNMMKIYLSRVICPISHAKDGNTPWEENESEQVICRAPIHSTWVYAQGLCEHSHVGQRHGES